MAGGPMAYEGPPASTLRESRPAPGALCLLAPHTSSPWKASRGVHTFLRIRPSSPSSHGGPPCIGLLGGPAEGERGTPLQQHASVLHAVTMGAPSSLMDPRRRLSSGLKSLPSLTLGRTRAVTCVYPEGGLLPQGSAKGPPILGPLPSSAPPEAPRAAVMVLPAASQGPTAAESRGPPTQKRALLCPHQGPPRKAPLSIALGPPSLHQGGAGSGGALPVCGESCLGQKGYEGPFRFGGLLEPHALQEEVFQRVGLPAAEALLSGLNACIAVHGASGSGKTYTMVGPLAGAPKGLRRSSTSKSSSSSSSSRSSGSSGSDWGLALRTIDYVMRALEGLQVEGTPPRPAAEVWLSATEVYCDKLRDLLGAARSFKGDPPGPSGVGPLLGGAPPLRVRSAADAVAAVSRAFAQRVSRETAANSSSSRSHAILTLSIVTPGAAKGGPRLCLLDLAGAERQQRAEMPGAPQGAPTHLSHPSWHQGPPKALLALEAASISKSLTAFMAVIAALGRHCAAARNGSRPFSRGALSGRLLQPELDSNKALTAQEPHKKTAATCLPHYTQLRRAFEGPSAHGKNGEAAGDLMGLQGPPLRPAQQLPGWPLVPFRDSCLTMLLREVLDGCGHVALVFTVSSKGSSRSPTLQTLRFSSLASLLGPFALKGRRGPLNAHKGCTAKSVGAPLERALTTTQLSATDLEAAAAAATAAARASAVAAAATAPAAAIAAAAQAPEQSRQTVQQRSSRIPLAARGDPATAGGGSRHQRASGGPLAGPPSSANFVSLAREPSLIMGPPTARHKGRSNAAEARGTAPKETLRPQQPAHKTVSQASPVKGPPGTPPKGPSNGFSNAEVGRAAAEDAQKTVNQGAFCSGQAKRQAVHRAATGQRNKDGSILADSAAAAAAAAAN
ncbi:hypothetical protein Efla_006170 [Eimeria flavescens]